jgi:hypothetical protein
VTTTPCLALGNTTAPAPDTVVATDGESGECNELWVDLIVSDLTGNPELFAANFDLVYPANLVLLVVPNTAGSVLASDGVAVNVEAAEQVAGRATVGITRLDSTGPGVVVTGERLLVQLRFARLAGSGSGELTFENAQLLDSQGDPGGPQEIPGITWTGGTVQILQN